MALKKNEPTQFGFDVPNAYQRVENVKLRKTSMQFQLCIYSDVTKTAFSHKNYACAYDMAGANPIAQAYAHLKTLPEFAGATDC
jgi:hypothetical protein